MVTTLQYVKGIYVRLNVITLNYMYGCVGTQYMGEVVTHQSSVFDFKGK